MCAPHHPRKHVTGPVFTSTCSRRCHWHAVGATPIAPGEVQTPAHRDAYSGTEALAVRWREPSPAPSPRIRSGDSDGRGIRVRHLRAGCERASIDGVMGRVRIPIFFDYASTLCYIAWRIVRELESELGFEALWKGVPIAQRDFRAKPG